MSKHHLAREFEDLTKDIMTDSRLHQMKNYFQHGRVTTFDHAVDVARMSFLIHKGLRLKSDPKELLRGALLHDYFFLRLAQGIYSNSRGKRVILSLGQSPWILSCRSCCQKCKKRF